MHIALCDSDPGDRKQMERLLTRESDKRVNKSGVFYIDTFGSKDALLDNPLVYDAYFLDVINPDCNAYNIACSIREKGIASPIVFCISSVDYRQGNELLPNSVFINKPIKVNELSLILDEILLQQKEQRVPKIEFRNHTETFYLEEKEILYCQGNDYYIDIYLVNGKTLSATTFIDNLWMELTPFKALILANKNTIVNARYIENVTTFSLTMNNQAKIKITPGLKSAIKKVMTSIS